MAAIAPDLLGVALAPVTQDEFCARLADWASDGAGPPKLISYLNAHNFNTAYGDAEYAAILRAADLVYADGMGVVWGWRALGFEAPERVNAGDFIDRFCSILAARGLSVFLLGAKPGEAERTASAWRAAAPGLRIAGHCDGYFSDSDEARVADAIREARPDVLLVGMGVPRQEKWAARWRASLGIPVIWCVGALFEYYGAKRPRAPVWMRRSGLEWLWRLALEPGRLWRRYLVGNVAFVWRIAQLRRAMARGRARMRAANKDTA